MRSVLTVRVERTLTVVRIRVCSVLVILYASAERMEIPDKKAAVRSPDSRFSQTRPFIRIAF